MTQTQQENLLTVREVAKALEVHVTTVRHWINDGEMEAMRLPHVNKRTVYRIKASVLSTRLGEK